MKSQTTLVWKNIYKRLNKILRTHQALEVIIQHKRKIKRRNRRIRNKQFQKGQRKVGSTCFSFKLLLTTYLVYL